MFFLGVGPLVAFFFLFSLIVSILDVVTLCSLSASVERRNTASNKKTKKQKKQNETQSLRVSVCVCDALLLVPGGFFFRLRCWLMYRFFLCVLLFFLFFPAVAAVENVKRRTHVVEGETETKTKAIPRTMDSWIPISGHPHLSFILRELYGSVAICVRNKGTTSMHMVVDCSQSVNALLLRTDAQGAPLSTLALRYVVDAGQTVMVGGLSPASSAHPLQPKVSISVIPLESVNRAAGSLVGDQADDPNQVMELADASSAQIASWINKRRQR